MDNSFDFKPTDLWDNGYTGAFAINRGDFYFSNFASRAKFSTSANSVDVTVFNNEALEVASIGLRINGADFTNAVCPFFGIDTITISLPPGHKTVELIEGGQDKAGSIATGTFLVMAVFDDAAELLTPSFSKRAVIYGDSISAGAHATIRPLEGWSVLFRQYYGDSTVIEGWGSRALKDDCYDRVARRNFVDRIASYRPNDIILFIGTNDYGIPDLWGAQDFGSAYRDLLDELYLAIPTASIHCYSPLKRIAEGPNGYGNILDDYRTEIRKAAHGRPWATYRDGKAILTASDMAEDGIHPSTAGHAKLALTVKNDLGL